jgi:HK97 family phage major capsid protein
VAFNNQITRTDASALIPEDVSREIIQGAVEQSAALRLFRNVPMSRNQQRMPVLNALPVAYFVNGDTGRKQTTKVEWKNQYLNVEEIATIVPVPENVLADVDYDLWAQIQPLIEEAVGKALDAAIFFNQNKPGSWPAAIVNGARAAGNTFTVGTSSTAEGGIAGDVGEVMGLVEEDGYDAGPHVAPKRFRRRLRKARSAQGERLTEVSTTSVDGTEIEYVMSDLFPKPVGGTTPQNGVELITGDWNRGIVGVRADMNWKLLDQAPIFDENDNLVINLAQEDAVAMRVTARYAFAIANPINREQPIEANRYPFGILESVPA